MTDFTVSIRDRRSGLEVQSDIQLTPTTWSANIDGSATADIEGAGPLSALAQALDWLGNTARVLNPHGERVHSVIINKVELRTGGARITYDLANTYNAIIVRYSYPNMPDDDPGITGWATDQESIDRYGRRALIYSAGNTNQADAERIRDQLLDRIKDRGVTIEQSTSKAGVSLQGVGHLSGLRQRYYEQSLGLVELQATGNTAIAVGWAYSSTEVAFHNRKIGALGDLFKGFLHRGPLLIGGSTFNDGTVNISSSGDEGATSFGPVTTIRFEQHDDIYDEGAGGLSVFTAEEPIQISGSASNDGLWFVDTVESAIYLTVSPNTIVDESAGASVTMVQGTSVTVDKDLTTETTSTGTKTLTALGVKIAQPFQHTASAAWTPRSVEITAEAVNSPTDSLRAEIYTDNAGEPGTLLDTATITGASMGSGELKHTLTFGGVASLSPSLTYHLVLSRTGANNTSAYYVVKLTRDFDYAYGSCLLSDGSAWTPQATGVHLPFKIQDGWKIDYFLQQMLTELADQTNFDFIPASNREAPYRSLEKTGWDELQALLKNYDTPNLRGVFVTADGKTVSIHERPGDVRYEMLTIDEQGVISDATGAPLAQGVLPVGRKAQVLFSGASPGIGQATPFLIAEARYSTSSQSLTLQSESALSAMDIGITLEDG